MIKIKNLTHIYKNRNNGAVKEINLHIKKGESLVIIGSSGSGKSTLLKCINRLVSPTRGQVFIDDEELLRCQTKEATKIRGKVGMIFQNFNLVERETVIKNVLNGRLRFNTSLRTILSRFSETDHEIARTNLKNVGLEGYEEERVANLSGGQKQRVAIARALSQEPKVILADEPVSSLDPKLMKEIMDLLVGLCAQKDITLVTSLHFLDFAKRYGSRIIGMRDGSIVFDGSSDDISEKDIVDIYGQTKDWHPYDKIGL